MQKAGNSKEELEIQKRQPDDLQHFRAVPLAAASRKQRSARAAAALPRARAMDFRVNLDDLAKQFKDVKKLFTTSGPGLPESDAEMVTEAARSYAEGALLTSARTCDARDLRKPRPATRRD